MKLATILVVILLTSINVSAQERPILYDTIICHGTTQHFDTFVPPRVIDPQESRSKTGKIENSSFVVRYFGFSPEAQAAFQYAVDIWDSYISSPVPIRINANWTSITSSEGSITLGSAIYGNVEINFNAGKTGVFYPVALAEKLEGEAINSDGQSDLTANFNKEVDWYLGTDGRPGGSQHDLVSVVLHEIGHGLGFIDSFRASEENNIGSWGLQSTSQPIVYDTYVGNNTTENLFVDFYDRNSSQLYGALTGNNVYFISEKVRESAGGSYPKLYAPSTWNPGSSIAHLDEISFRAGNVNSLMTPQIGRGEAIHNPGPITLAILEEMGWKTLYLNHEPITFSDPVTKEIIVEMNITGDLSVKSGTPRLHYGTDLSQEENVVIMQSIGAGNYRAVIPAPNEPASYEYYLSARDQDNKLYTNPGNAPSIFYSFDVFNDEEGPIIRHFPENFVIQGAEELTLGLEVSDKAGLSSLFLEYTVNGEDWNSIEVTKTVSRDNFYQVDLPLDDINSSSFQYHFNATDLSSESKTSRFPEQGDINVEVVELGTPVPSYTSAFDSGSEDDFLLKGMEITQPEGFSTPALHSLHPYFTGIGPDFKSNLIAILRHPIILESEKPFMMFEEVVLVEPSSEGSTFSTPSFRDYVIVEGSSNRGKNWIQFSDGWDSREQTAWKMAYDSELTLQGSSAVGTEELQRFHFIDLRGKNAFATSDEILIRFRLQTDERKFAWGWSIDNLRIQENVNSVENLEEEETLIYPNPSNNWVNIKLPSKNIQQTPTFELFNITGQRVSTKINQLDSGLYRLDISSLPRGIYILTLHSKDLNQKIKFQKK